MKSKIKKSEKLGRILFSCKKHKNFLFWLQQFSQFLFGFRLLTPLRFIYKEKMNAKYRRKQEKRR